MSLSSGLTRAVFAAILAITDLGGGKYGDDEIIGTNEKANFDAWYQSKSIKQCVVEGERDLVATLLEGGVIAPGQASSSPSGSSATRLRTTALTRRR